MSRVRSPAVAGRFYAADPSVLRAAVRGYLREARDDPALPRSAPPEALVAPHAGYVFSGPVAGSAYAALARSGRSPTTVVLIGPAHYRPVRGLAVPTARAFRTPLGTVPVDGGAMEAARALPIVQEDDRAHAPEHALETQIPFLQVVLGDFAVVPLLAGAASGGEVAAVLDALWGENTLVVISSDLSHYLPYGEARRRDARTAAAVEALDPGAVGPDDACGWMPLRGLLEAARGRGLGARTLDLRNSGDTVGPRDRVVGYGAFAFGAAAGGSGRDGGHG
ncbi:MAG: AmmeMemoRadiSam system protein B [Gemmatimonadota bacterium]|jgi:AmmeMemoRadiSam system protein B